MRNCYPLSFAKSFLVLLLVAALSVPKLNAQTTITTPYTGGTTFFAAPANIAFVAANANSYGVVLTGVSQYCTTEANNSVWELYYSATSLSGTGSPVPGAAWNLIATSAPVPVTADGIVPVFTGLNFIIPAGTQYRFVMRSNGPGNVTYVITANPATTLFTADGVSLKTGTEQIAGANVGYSGNGTTLATTPRYWHGAITFRPDGPCTDPPVPGTVTSTAVNPVCTSANFTLGLTGGTGGTGQTHQWQSSTSAGGPWSNIPLATNATLTTSQTAPTLYYRCQVTCGTTVSSAAYMVTANDCVPAYCPSAASSAGDTDIFGVSINGVSNNSTCTVLAPGPGSALGLYSNFYPLGPLTTIFPGTTIPVTVTLDDCSPPPYFDGGCAVWIDFNRNGLFTDPGEQVYVDNAQIFTPRTISFNVNVPINAVAGITGMRVITSETNTGAALVPCLNAYGFGETEDYYINIGSATPCSGTPVAGTSVSSSTNIVCAGTPFTLSLSGSSVVSGLTYQWQSGPSTTGPWTNIPGATSLYYTTVQSLNSVYYQCVVTCTNGGGNSTSIPVQVTSSTGPTYATMPYAESFEATWINGCGTRDIPNQYWKNTPFTGNQSWRRNDDGASAAWTTTAGAYTPASSHGVSSARFHSDVAPAASTGSLDIYLNCNTYTPFKRLVFDYINTSGTDSLIVEISTNGGANFTRLDAVALATAWTTSEMYFSSSSATTVVRFTGKSDNGTTDFGLDNIKLNNWADCTGAPTGGTVSAVPTGGICVNTPIDLTLSGASDGNAITYQWQLSTNGTAGPWTDIPGATNFTATVFQTTTTTYRCITSCQTSSLVALSNTVTVASNPIPGGLYTINSAAATDFPTGTNFNSFNAAYNAIKCGISSSVVFDVLTGANAGVYTEQLIMNGQIPNASPTRTVTFKGNGKVLTFAPTTGERAVIKLKNINYIIFDSLTINPTGTFGIGVHLTNDADSNVVKKCTINTSLTGTTAANFAGIAISGSDTDPIGLGTAVTAQCDANIIDGNNINGGVYGITLAGILAGAHGNNKIINNNVKDFYNYGMYVNGSYKTLVEKNSFSRPTRTNFATEFNGIYYTGQSDSDTLSKNKIFNPSGAAVGNNHAFNGINFNNSIATSGAEKYVINNLIYGVNNGGIAYGIVNTGSTNVQYFHNTVSLDSVGANSSAAARGFSQTGAVSGLYFYNNLISVTRGGTGIKHCIYLSTQFTFADNNNYYMGAAAGSNHVGFFTSNRTTIADWKLASGPTRDQASLSVVPVYTDPSAAVADFHPNNANLDNKGFNLGLVPDDIIGVVRSVTTPDIGAYEFVPSPCSLPLVTGSTVISASTICQNQPVVLGLSIGAFGSSQTFQWQTSPTGAAPWTLIGTPMPVPDTVILSSTSLYYQCVIKCGSASDVSTAVLLNVTPALQTGVYTINSSSPTSIPPIPNVVGSNNFNSFADAKAAMSCGVVGTGNVIFNVQTGANAGVYTEQLKLDSIKGVNVNRQIIFNGNGNTIKFNPISNTERAVIKLNGADFITFDSLRIDASESTTYGYAVQLINNADSNTFRKCAILASTAIASTNFAGVVINATDAGVIATGNTWCDGNKFDRDSITGGYYGVTLVGSATQLINNNEFTNNNITEFYNYGIYAIGTYNTFITGNSFTRPTRVSVGNGSAAIYFATAVSSRLTVSKNRIFKLFGGVPTSTAGAYGIYHNNVDAAAGNEAIVSNNAIYNIGGIGFIYGLYNLGSNNVFYHHNTISIDDETSANAVSVGFYQNTDAVGVQFTNNMVTIRRATAANPIRQAIFLGSTTTEVASNYNNLLVTGLGTNTFIGSRAGTNYSTLAAWRTATLKDLNSLNFDPLYQDPLNGNFTPQMEPLNNQGTALNYATDINNAFRSLFTPDIGAWEMAAPAPCAVPPVAGTASVTPNAGVCLEVPIRLTLTGHSPLGSITFQWQASTDGIGGWTDIGPLQYSPTLDTLSSVTRFYRCKVICNGNFTYSTTTSVTLNQIVLAGTYTIDANTALPTWAGTAGAVGSNFQTVQEAVNAILCGMTGSVVFNMRGTFNEQIRIPYVPGTSPNTTVTFQSHDGLPSSAGLTFNATNAGANYTLRLDSCKYFTFRNITISSTNTVNGRAVEFINTASFDSISRCVINAPVTTSVANTMAAVYANALKGTNIVLKGNTINNGSSGINFNGTSVAIPTVDHLIDSNFVTGAYVNGIYANFNQRLRISRNTVNVSAPLAASSYGIYATNCDSAYQLTNNKVNINNATTITYGMYLTLCDASELNRGKVTGNDIVAGTGNTGNSYGLYIDASTLYADVLNNTISINTTGGISHGIYCSNASFGNYYNNSVNNMATGATKYAGYFLNSTATSLNVKNNIFSHRGGGKALFMTQTGGISSDYNMLYTTGPVLVERSGTNFATLAAWRTAASLDLFSIVYAPAFMSNTDLKPDLANVDVWAIHGRGTQINNNTYDHDGNSRPVTLLTGVPDLGAYEFYPTALPTVLTATPAAPAANTEQTFMYGTDTVMKLKWGAVFPPSIEVRRYSGVVPSGLAAASLDSMYFYTKVEIPGGSNYDYDAKLYYLDPWLGSIGGLTSGVYQLGLGKTTSTVGDPWIVGSTSRNEVPKRMIYQNSVSFLDRFTGLVNPYAPPVLPDKDSSNRGRRFWVAYPVNQLAGGTSQQMALYLSALEPANVQVKINGTTYVRNYFVPANTVVATASPANLDYIPKTGPQNAFITTAGLSDRGISIVSDVPIVVYAHVLGSTSSGAAMLMPVGVWGYEYKTLGITQQWGTGGNSYFYVIADNDNTVIDVTPTVGVQNAGMSAGTTSTITLNKGEVFQVVASSTTQELTGSTVKSVPNSAGKCYPIATFSGTSRTQQGLPCNGGGDFMMQQNFPSTAWGKRYLTAPSSLSTTTTTGPASLTQGNLFRIAVKDPSTVITRNGSPLTATLQNNHYYQYQSTTADYIEADKPIMIAQFLSGACSGVGDPEMMYISPIEQGINSVGFYRNTIESIQTNHLTMIIPTNGMSSLVITDGIGGVVTPDYVYDHPQNSLIPNGVNYKVVVKNWTSAQSQVRVTSDSNFTGITYGLGSVESYGYNIGTKVKNLQAGGGPVIPGATNQEYTCAKTPFQLSMNLPVIPGSITWKLTSVPNLYTHPGMVPATDVGPLVNPTPTGTIIVGGEVRYVFTLPQLYVFTAPGLYAIQVTYTHPTIESCDNTQTDIIYVQVIPSPAISFSTTFAGCAGNTATFVADNATPNGIAVNYWTWGFNNGTTATGATASFTYPNAGTFTDTLHVVTSDGCIRDTTKQIVVNPLPVVTFAVDSVAICSGAGTTFTIQSPLPGATYNWYDAATGGNLVFTGTSYVLTNVTATDTFYVEGISAAGCTSVGRKRVVVNMLNPLTPTVVSVASSTVNSVTFSWTAVAGAASYQVSVNGGTYIIPSSGATGLTHTVTGMGILTNTNVVVQAIGIISCQTSTSTSVSGCTNSAPVITPDVASICTGGNSTFLVNTPLPPNVTYAWYTAATGGTALTTGGAYTINASGSSFTANSLSPAGTYDFYAGHANSVTGCVGTIRKKVTITVLAPLAKPVVTWVLASTTPTSLTFTWLAVPSATGYQISTDNGTTWTTPSTGATGLSHTVTGLTPNTTVSILVRALGTLPCQTSVSDAVTGKTFTDAVYVPNAFNPNSTAPENRVLRVYGYVIQSMQFMVFNQWGEKVFESTNQNAGWDGNYKGKQQPSGVYIYLLKFTTITGATQEMKGSVSLIR